MDKNRFDRISRAFAERRVSRRKPFTTGVTGLAASALAVAGARRSSVAQEATPAMEPGNDTLAGAPTMLFVQTFQSGTIATVEGVEGRYTLTLEGGHGQTVYFSDRPARLAGATSTGEFLDRLGFPDDNPPNAALVVETAPGRPTWRWSSSSARSTTRRRGA